MSFIDEIEFDIMKGLPVQTLRERTDVWEVEGLDGSGAMTMGKGDGEFKLKTVVYMEDNDAANDLIAACESLQGVIVTIVDDFGDTYESNLVKALDTSDAKKPVIFLGDPAIRVFIGWQFVKVS